MKVIIHAGTHKTGTTSIQHALRKNRVQLAENGVLYPLLAPYTKTHHRFAHDLTGADPERLERAEGFALAALEAAAPDTQVLVLSAEPIYRHVDGSDSWEGYGDLADYWVRRVAYLRRVAGLFSDPEIELLLFFRDRDAFARSFRHELDKEQIWSGTEDAFFSTFARLLDYERQLAAFRTAFPVVTVLDYDACVQREGSVLPAFFRAIGAAVPPESAGIWENASN